MSKQKVVLLESRRLPYIQGESITESKSPSKFHIEHGLDSQKKQTFEKPEKCNCHFYFVLEP